MEWWGDSNQTHESDGADEKRQSEASESGKT